MGEDGIDNLTAAEEDKDMVKELANRDRGRKGIDTKGSKGKKKDELFDSEEESHAITDSDSDGSEEAAPVKAARGRGRGRWVAKSPAKKGGRGRAPAQSTIAAAFARSQASQPAKQTQQSQASVRPSQRNKKQMFASDSDDDLLGAL